MVQAGAVGGDRPLRPALYAGPTALCAPGGGQALLPSDPGAPTEAGLACPLHQEGGTPRGVPSLAQQSQAGLAQE